MADERKERSIDRVPGRLMVRQDRRLRIDGAGHIVVRWLTLTDEHSDRRPPPAWLQWFLEDGTVVKLTSDGAGQQRSGGTIRNGFDVYDGTTEWSMWAWDFPLNQVPFTSWQSRA